MNPVVCVQLRSNFDQKDSGSNGDEQLLEDLCTNIQSICIESAKTKNRSSNNTKKLLKCDIERWIDAEEDASIVFPEVEEQIPKKDAKKTISKNDKKQLCALLLIKILLNLSRPKVKQNN